MGEEGGCECREGEGVRSGWVRWGGCEEGGCEEWMGEEGRV